MKLVRDFTQAKMDKDLHDRYIREGEYRDMLNGRVLSSDQDGVGVIEKFRGTLAVNAPALPSNDYNVVGMVAHEDFIYYIATDNTNTLIGEYNKDTDTHRYVYDSRLLSTKTIVLNKEILIANIIVFEGLLIFCDKNNTRPYKINIENTAGDFGYYENPEDTYLIKAPPAEPVVSSLDDGTDINFLRSEPFQFAARYIYEDGEVSAISTYSGTEVEVEDEETIDGATAVVLGRGNATNDVDINTTTDRFDNIETDSFSPPLGALRNATSVDITSDGETIVAATNQAAMYIVADSVLGYRIIQSWSSQSTEEITETGWQAAVVSNDGNTILFADHRNDENLYIMKARTPVDSDSVLDEVLVITGGEENEANSGQRIAMSAQGNICWAIWQDSAYKSSAFGNEGSWSQSIDFQTTLGIGITVRSVCCSSDGNVAYVTMRTPGNGTSVFRTRDGGSNWSEVFREDDYFPFQISCSASGRVVAYGASTSEGTGAGTGTTRIGHIFVSTNFGTTFTERESSVDLYSVTSVAVSTTGKYIYAITGNNGTDTYAELHISRNFGSSFTRETQTSIIRQPFMAIACVNNDSPAQNVDLVRNTNNRIDISYNTGNKHVTDIELLARTVRTNRLYRITTINKEARGLSDNVTATLNFKNDGNYPLIAERDTNKLYDNVPHKANSFTLTQNTLIFGHYTDGYSLTNPDDSNIVTNASVAIIPSALDTTTTNRSLKTNTHNTYGIIYYDDFNRSSSVLEIAEVDIPSVHANTTTPVMRARVTINHLAPDWATKYKFARKSTILDYSIVNGFDNAYAVGDETYLEITSLVDIVPQENDTLELIAELNRTEDSDDAYIIVAERIEVPILRYVDLSAGGRQTVSVSLSDGTTTTRTEATSGDTADPVPRGRYIVIAALNNMRYTNSDISAEQSEFGNSVFYIIRNRDLEDTRLFEEIPGVYNIDANRRHLSGTETGDQNQTSTLSAIVNLNDDYDVVWGLFPFRELYRYSTTAVLSNLGRPNAVSENFRQVERFAGLIASEQYVEDTNFNGLSSFNLSLIPYKDLDKRDGAIELIDAEDTNIEVYQRNKLSRVLYRKNVLTTATGTQAVSQTSDIWGEQIRSVTEYGLSHAESWVSWGNHRYFVDAERGVVIRKAQDGPTEVSSYGMLDYFHDTLFANRNSRIRGAYEPKYNNYVLSVGNTDTLIFSERNNGWETRVSYIPDITTNDGNDVYSFKTGQLYRHNATSTYNDFYGTTYNTTVDTVINQAAELVKTYSAMKVEGTRPNGVTFTTENATTTIDNTFFEKREEFEYAIIPSGNSSASFSMVIAGLVSAVVTSSATIPLNNYRRENLHIGDVAYFNNGGTLERLGVINEINEFNIVLDSTVTRAIGDMIIAIEENVINGDLLKGSVILINMTYSGNNAIEVESIEVEADESKQ